MRRLPISNECPAHTLTAMRELHLGACALDAALQGAYQASLQEAIDMSMCSTDDEETLPNTSPLVGRRNAPRTENCHECCAIREARLSINGVQKEFHGGDALCKLIGNFLVCQAINED
jgi:hypothetical protein